MFSFASSLNPENEGKNWLTIKDSGAWKLTTCGYIS